MELEEEQYYPTVSSTIKYIDSRTINFHTEQACEYLFGPWLGNSVFVEQRLLKHLPNYIPFYLYCVQCNLLPPNERPVHHRDAAWHAFHLWRDFVVQCMISPQYNNNVNERDH